MLFRISLIVPIISSAISIGLGIALLTAENTTGNGDAYYWMAVNTSKTCQGLVQLTVVNETDSDRSTLNSPIGIPDFVNPSGIFDGLEDTLKNVFDNLTIGINQGVMDLQGELLSSLTKTLGIKDVYVLYLSKICEGKFRNAGNPDSPFEITECSKYSDSGQGLRNISSAIPSSFTFARTNISIPLIAALGLTIGTVVDVATGAATALQVIAIIAVTSTGLMLLGSLFAVVMLRPLAAILNMLFGILSSVAYLFSAIVTTAIVVAGSSSINGMGSTFGLSTRQGQSFLAMMWVGAILALVASLYWVLVWFVEFRKTSFKRRRRTAEEMGNWKGIFSEVKGDLQLRQRFKGFH